MLRLTLDTSVFFIDPYSVELVHDSAVPTYGDPQGKDNVAGELKPITLVELAGGTVLRVDQSPGEVAVLIERILHDERGTTAPARGDAWKGK